jgi:alpha-methylacyl-CoA racemase
MEISGALEPKFYKELVARLFPGGTEDLPDRDDCRNWPALRDLFTLTFLGKTRKEWEDIFDGTDACVTPVKTFRELKEEKGFRLAPPVRLKACPAREEVDAWAGVALTPGEGGRAALQEWWGLNEGVDWIEGAEGAFLAVEKAEGEEAPVLVREKAKL